MAGAAGVALLLLVVVLTLAVGTVLQGPGAVSFAQAGCDPISSRPAPIRGGHVPVGQRVDYPVSPPAFGTHWGNYLQGPEIRSFYTVADRPPVERLVHSLEHGYTILWYDETLGERDLARVRSIASGGIGSKLIAAPWTSDDGPPFERGKHVALTHWSVGGDPDARQTALAEESAAAGIWAYCDRPSLEAVELFMEEYPYTDSPEPGAP